MLHVFGAGSLNGSRLLSLFEVVGCYSVRGGVGLFASRLECQTSTCLKDLARGWDGGHAITFQD